MPTSANTEADTDADAASTALAHVYVPVKAAVQACVRDPVEEQYRVVSDACLSIFTDELHLFDFCDALRHAFLGADGVLVRAITEALVASIEAHGAVATSHLDVCLRDALDVAQADPASVAANCKCVPT